MLPSRYEDDVKMAQELPLKVVELAVALTRGEDCLFALHDAVLEAGVTDLAEIFNCYHKQEELVMLNPKTSTRMVTYHKRAKMWAIWICIINDIQHMPIKYNHACGAIDQFQMRKATHYLYHGMLELGADWF